MKALKIEGTKHLTSNNKATSISKLQVGEEEVSN